MNLQKLTKRILILKQKIKKAEEYKAKALKKTGKDKFRNKMSKRIDSLTSKLENLEVKAKKIKLLKTKINATLTAQKKTAIENIINGGFYTSSLDGTFAASDFEASTNNFKDAFFINKDLADLKTIKDLLRNPNLVTNLETEFTKLTEVKTYLGLNIAKATTFNTATAEGIDSIAAEIAKDTYDNLSKEAKAIINNNKDYLNLKTALTKKFKVLKTKKIYLESAITDWKAKKATTTTFNAATEEGINAITKEIAKSNYQISIVMPKKSQLKTNLEQKKTYLKTKRANLENAKTYLKQDIKLATTFNEATAKGIKSIDDEIAKDNYNSLSDEVKEIVDHNVNSDAKTALTKKFDDLKAKKLNLENAKTYLKQDIKLATTFNEATAKGIKSINDEIAKDNYNSLSDEVKEIVDHNVNSDAKTALTKKFDDLKAKKLNLENAKTYLKQDIKLATTFNEATAEGIKSIDDEIAKGDYSTLSNEAKLIVDHNDNSVVKNTLTEKITALETKQTDLTSTKDYLKQDIADATTFNAATEEGINLITEEIAKGNYQGVSTEVKTIINHADNSNSKAALELKITALETKKTHLESAKTYLELNIAEASTFNEATAEGIKSINDEIAKDTYNSLSKEAKAIINANNDYLNVKTALTNKFTALETKKADLIQELITISSGGNHISPFKNFIVTDQFDGKDTTENKLKESTLTFSDRESSTDDSNTALTNIPKEVLSINEDSKALKNTPDKEVETVKPIATDIKDEDGQDKGIGALTEKSKSKKIEIIGTTGAIQQNQGLGVGVIISIVLGVWFLGVLISTFLFKTFKTKKNRRKNLKQ